MLEGQYVFNIMKHQFKETTKLDKIKIYKNVLLDTK